MLAIGSIFKFLKGFKVHLVNPLMLQKASWDHYIVSASGTTAAGLPDGDSDGFTVTVDKDEVDVRTVRTF